MAEPPQGPFNELINLRQQDPPISRLIRFEELTRSLIAPKQNKNSFNFVIFHQKWDNK